MKAIKIWCLVLLCSLFAVQRSQAQEQEIEQLLLNVEKLSQFKQILQQMKQGYTVLTNGYNAVKNISQGNFSLHEVFLNSLLAVNPEIKKYPHVADIITAQVSIVSEYKKAYSRFKTSGNFSASELEYLGRVYGQLLDQSVDNLDELAMVITSSKLRMSDDERLKAIDRIYGDTQDKLQFLRVFNQGTGILNLQRQQEKASIKSAQELYNLK